MRNNLLYLMATTLTCACSGTKLELGVQEQTGGSSAESGGAAGRDSGGRATTGASSGAGDGGRVPSDGSGGRAPTGGAVTGSGGREEGGVSGFVPPSVWDELTLTESGGFTAPPGEGSECSLFMYESTYTVTAEPSVFRFDICDGTSERQMIRRSGFPLNAEELSQVQAAVSALEPGQGNACGADKATLLLDIEAPSRTYNLADDFYSCQPNPENRVFVSNIDPLANLLRGWALSVARPEANTIVVTRLEGFPAPPPAQPNFACDSRIYENRYVADLAAGTFEWDLCQSYVLKQGLRALEESEVAAVEAAYRALRVSSRVVCGADKPVLLAHIDTDEGTLDYADDFYSCQPPPAGAKFVSNIDVLFEALAELVPR